MTIVALLLAAPAWGQSPSHTPRRTTELAERSAELSFLSEACGEPRYKFTVRWLNQVGDPRIVDDIARRFAALLDARPRPSKARACSELLFKYGPSGVVEAGWIEERAP